MPQLVKEFHRFYWNCIHNTPLDPSLIQMNPVRNVFKSIFQSIFISHIRFLQLSGFLTAILYEFLIFPSMLHVPPTSSPWSDNCNNTSISPTAAINLYTHETHRQLPLRHTFFFRKINFNSTLPLTLPSRKWPHPSSSPTNMSQQVRNRMSESPRFLVLQPLAWVCCIWWKAQIMDFGDSKTRSVLVFSRKDEKPTNHSWTRL
jgi:hypothetical protein